MHHLVKAPDSRARQDLALAQAAIGAAFPLKTAHKKELPYAVQELSQSLTAERSQIQGYWQKPSLTGAYLYYFLPWNLLRLSWLMPGLKLDLPAGSRVLDLGSGPLTMPLGLWITHPELRDTPLSIICSDPAQRPMELGRSVLEKLSAPSGEKSSDKSPWDVQLLRAPLDIALRKAGKVKLITAGNVLNEISIKQERLEERLEEIFFSMDRILEPGGQIFLMEPGTRLGGKLVSLVRRIALEEGYTVEAPCTHEALCPYAPLDLEDEEDDAPPARRGRAHPSTRQPSGWCHFSLSSDGAPRELIELSRAAELEKERLSFACLLLRKPKQEGASGRVAREKAVSGGVLTPVRVVSDPIRLPQTGDTARYVCSSHGIGLLHHAYECKSGMFVEALLPDKGGKDFKSGALNMEIPQGSSIGRKRFPTQEQGTRDHQRTRDQEHAPRRTFDQGGGADTTFRQQEANGKQGQAESDRQGKGLARHGNGAKKAATGQGPRSKRSSGYGSGQEKKGSGSNYTPSRPEDSAGESRWINETSGKEPRSKGGNPDSRTPHSKAGSPDSRTTRSKADTPGSRRARSEDGHAASKAHRSESGEPYNKSPRSKIGNPASGTPRSNGGNPESNTRPAKTAESGNNTPPSKAGNPVSKSPSYKVVHEGSDNRAHSPAGREDSGSKAKGSGSNGSKAKGSGSKAGSGGSVKKGTPGKKTAKKTRKAGN